MKLALVNGGIYNSRSTTVKLDDGELIVYSVMESSDLPECPVCLQNYNGEYSIPRVLACGHTTCEPCLNCLPQKYPETIRCPACTQLVKFPSQGPSFLPKNIDLLRLIPSCTHSQKTPNFLPQFDPLTRLWSDEFYFKWKNWVLPEDGVVHEDKEKGYSFLKGSNRKVRLFNVAADALLLSYGNDSIFRINYVARIMNFLYGIEEEVIEELSSILRICSKHSRVSKAYGLWLDLKDGILYLVFEKLNCSILDPFPRFENGLVKEFLASFSMIGTEICETVIALHLENLFFGCLSLSCFELDDFGHVNISFSEVLPNARIVREAVTEAGIPGKRIGEKEMRILVNEFFKNEIFISPEILFEILKKEGFEVDCGSSVCSAMYRSDVWSLACVLLRLLIGKKFINELVGYVGEFISKVAQEYCSGLYTGLVEKVSCLVGSMLGEELEPLQQILCRCLDFDPENRPLVTDVRKCVRDLILGLQFDAMLKLDDYIEEKDKAHYLVLGELPLAFRKMSKLNNKSGEQGVENGNGENASQIEEMRVKKDFAEGLLDGNIKVKDMKGHLDCVTGLAIGGGFLFSSSFDKSVCVWSLEDFSHLHTFKGHEHKITAVTFVNEGEPLCISGDSGGGIFLWSIAMPLRQEPLKEWYEEKDWRYSGIHALTTAGTGYLYTGSGDRLIKAWSLQEGVLSCTMNGHKSVVSTLAASRGVLYSGSWDGTIRLWSLSDHSLLTLLGEDMPGTAVPVLSLIVHQNMVVVAHENGQIKIWRNDVFMKSIQEHEGAVFAIGMEDRHLFTGGWDKRVSILELMGDDFQVETRAIGSISSSSAVSSLVYWHGKLFVGYGDRTVKVYYYGD